MWFRWPALRRFPASTSLELEAGCGSIGGIVIPKNPATTAASTTIMTARLYANAIGLPR